MEWLRGSIPHVSFLGKIHGVKYTNKNIQQYTKTGFPRRLGSNTGHSHGPLARYVKLRFVHAPGMPGTFSPPPRVSDPDMHQGTCMTHVPWCIPGSLTSSFIGSRWWGKRSRRMRHLQFSYLVRGPWKTTCILSIRNHFLMPLHKLD